VILSFYNFSANNAFGNSSLNGWIFHHSKSPYFKWLLQHEIERTYHETGLSWIFFTLSWKIDRKNDENSCKNGPAQHL